MGSREWGVGSRFDAKGNEKAHRCHVRGRGCSTSGTHPPDSQTRNTPKHIFREPDGCVPEVHTRSGFRVHTRQIPKKSKGCVPLVHRCCGKDRACGGAGWRPRRVRQPQTLQCRNPPNQETVMSKCVVLGACHFEAHHYRSL